MNFGRYGENVSFPPPWSVEKRPARFSVNDANGQRLAYVYYEEEPGRREAAKLLTQDEARGRSIVAEHSRDSGNHG